MGNWLPENILVIIIVTIVATVVGKVTGFIFKSCAYSIISSDYILYICQSWN